jgi:hypothetical protein
MGQNLVLYYLIPEKNEQEEETELLKASCHLGLASVLL